MPFLSASVFFYKIVLKVALLWPRSWPDETWVVTVLSSFLKCDFLRLKLFGELAIDSTC